ncbi:hypothetical protein G9A89_017719 [Geosiphon pyriformis]|nr:hypothetical protein G9A89_017719 [Geosiphon pyriformis]
MDPVGFSVGGSGSGLAELGSWAIAKKKACIESVYSWGLSYKKSKKPDITGVVVDLLARPLPGHVLQNDCDKHKNINNMVAKETSYMDFNASETDDMMDNVTSKKMCTRTYVLKQLLKTPFFKNLSNGDTEIVLLEFRFVGSNQLLPVKSRVLEKKALS